MISRAMPPFKRLLSSSVNLVPWWIRNHICRIPGVAAFQRHLVRRVLDGAEFVHLINAGPAAGLRMRIQLPDDKQYWTGTWEHAVTQTLAAQTQRGAVCFDIGGHRGFMAGVMSLSGARAVYCFEPNPINIEKIRELIALNPDAGIELVPAAVGAADGVVSFSLMSEESMGKLATSRFQPEAAKSRQIEVEMRSLDSLVGDGTIEPPSLIKIDIEGAEAMVLAGAADVIAKFRPRLLIEVHSYDLLGECRQWLEARGYDCSILEDGGMPTCEAAFSVCHLIAAPR